MHIIGKYRKHGCVKLFWIVVPAIPQSEVLAKFFEEIGEKCGEILAKFFADFRPSISRENGRKKFHEKSLTFSTVHQIKFFSLLHLWGPRGPMNWTSLRPGLERTLYPDCANLRVPKRLRFQSQPPAIWNRCDLSCDVYLFSPDLGAIRLRFCRALCDFKFGEMQIQERKKHINIKKYPQNPRLGSHPKNSLCGGSFPGK